MSCRRATGRADHTCRREAQASEAQSDSGESDARRSTCRGARGAARLCSRRDPPALFLLVRTEASLVIPRRRLPATPPDSPTARAQLTSSAHKLAVPLLLLDRLAEVARQDAREHLEQQLEAHLCDGPVEATLSGRRNEASVRAGKDSARPHLGHLVAGDPAHAAASATAAYTQREETARTRAGRTG